MRTSQGVGADSTGGDFRFQGQWLESATGLYNFRARNYDSKTGTFLSRDPVDSTAQDLEALNPYQFVYNNPYVYSDPSGMFTMVELNAAFSAQNSLQAVKTYSGVQIKQYFKSKVGEALGNAFTGFVKKLLPFNGLDSFDALPKRFQDGIMFEDYLKGQICGIFNAVGGPFSNRLWMEPGILNSGEPSAPGLNCSSLFDDQTRKGFKRGKGSNPDFLFKDGLPTDTSNKAYLIGDVKLTMTAALKDVTGTGNNGNPDNQWIAMRNYAKKHIGVPMALYVTFKRFSKGGNLSDQQLASELAKASAKSFGKGVILLIANLLD